MAPAAKRPVLRFVVGFCLLMGPFALFFYGYLVETSAFEAYLRLNAAASAGVLRVLGESARSAGTLLQGPGAALEIRHGCDAIFPTALFVAGVLASPVAFRLKPLGIVAGSATLLALNLVRIVSLYYAQVRTPDWFHWLHVEFWQPAFIFFALALWVAWALRAVRRTTVPAPPAPDEAG